MTTTLVTETYAATYATANDQGEYGVDLIHQEIERDEYGDELSRQEAGWDWNGQPADEWSTENADELLSNLGWRRTDDWQHENDLGGNEGWTAQVEHV